MMIEMLSFWAQVLSLAKTEFQKYCLCNDQFFFHGKHCKEIWDEKSEEVPSCLKQEGMEKSGCSGEASHDRGVSKSCQPEPALQWWPGFLGHHWGPPWSLWRELGDMPCLNFGMKRSAHHSCFAHLTNRGTSCLINGSMASGQAVCSLGLGPRCHVMSQSGRGLYLVCTHNI